MSLFLKNRLRDVLAIAISLAGLLSVTFADGASAQKLTGDGICPTACGCIEKYTYDRDNEEKLPIDGDSGKELGSEFAISRNYSFKKPDPYTPTNFAVVEEWSKDLPEILEQEKKKLNGPKAVLYDFLWEKKQTINLFALKGLGGMVEGPFNGPRRAGEVSLDPTGTVSQKWYIPKLYVLKLGRGGTKQHCFLEEGFERYQRPNTWTTDYIQLPPNEPNQYIPSAKLLRCVPAKYLVEDIREQIEYLFFDNDFSAEIYALDFVVGITPILGTADLLYQGYLKKTLDGDLEAGATMCGSLASDLFIVGKALKGINAAAKTAKIIQVASYSAGAGSIIFTGGALWHKSYETELTAWDYGRQALLGLEVLALVTDQDLKTILKPYINRSIWTRKRPPSSVLACGPVCEQPNPVARSIDFAEFSTHDARVAASCTKGLPSAASEVVLPEVPEGLLDGIDRNKISPKALLELYKKDPPGLPRFLVRRDESRWLYANTKGEMRTTFLDTDGFFHAAMEKDSTATIFDHIRNPKYYATRSGWISLSDTTVWPEGNPAWGDTQLRVDVERLLQDMDKGVVDIKNLVIIPRDVLTKHLHEQFIKSLKGEQSPELDAYLKELLEGMVPILKEGEWTADFMGKEKWERLWELLSKMGFSNRYIEDHIMDRLKAYLLQVQNGEALWWGKIPESYMELIVSVNLPKTNLGPFHAYE